jgi:carotenoid cleavage dioxygenase-like enzyme
VQLVSDAAGAIEVDPASLHTTKELLFPPPHRDFHDSPPTPFGHFYAMGAAHALPAGPSSNALDAQTDLLGLISGLRVTKLDKRPEEVRLFRVRTEKGWGYRERIASIPLDRAPYMHAFGLLAGEAPGGGAASAFPGYRAAILVAAPVFFDFPKAGKTGGPMANVFEFDPTKRVVFYHVDLATGEARPFELDAPPFYYSHVSNAFQDGDSVFIDVTTYDGPFFARYTVPAMSNKTARDASTRARLQRFALDLVNGTARLERTVAHRGVPADLELMTINEHFKGRKYCHVYAYENNFVPDEERGERATGMASMAASRYDLCTGARAAFTRPYHYFHEPFFVPRPGGTAEDDGAVLVSAYDGAAQRGRVFVLNPDMSLAAEVEVPDMPYRTHTRFLFAGESTVLV